MIITILWAVAAVEAVAAGAAFTATDVVSILTALGVLITAIVGGTVTIISTLRTNRRETVEVGAKTDAVAKKVDEVHILTNSNLAAVNSKLDTSNNEIKVLKELVSDLKNERDKASLVAAATAQPRAKESGGEAPPPPAQAKPIDTLNVAKMVVAEVNPNVTAEVRAASERAEEAVKEAGEKAINEIKKATK